MLSYLYDNMRDAHLASFQTLLAINTSASQEVVSSLSKTGVLLNIWSTNENWMALLESTTRKMLYGKMIVGAWGLSAAKPRPFVLYVLPHRIIPDCAVADYP